eukprot:gene15476-17056_t
MPFVKKSVQGGRAFENEGKMNLSNYTLESKKTICILAPYSVTRAVEETVQAGHKKKIEVEKSIPSMKFQKLQYFDVNADFNVMNHMIPKNDVKTGKGTFGKKRKYSELLVDEGGQFEDEREVGKRGVGSKQLVKEKERSRKKERVRQQSRGKDKEQQERGKDSVKLNARENEKCKVSLKITEPDSQNKKKKKETVVSSEKSENKSKKALDEAIASIPKVDDDKHTTMSSVTKRSLFDDVLFPNDTDTTAVDVFENFSIADIPFTNDFESEFVLPTTENMKGTRVEKSQTSARSKDEGRGKASSLLRCYKRNVRNKKK